MKSLRMFLEQRGWHVNTHRDSNLFLNATYKDRYTVSIERSLGAIQPTYRTKWTIDGEVYHIISNRDEKFIFEELKKLEFK